ncbi:MAG: methylated-DNA--[protein]-cysteine S-methyltransferase, partial [Xanthomonadaceae bacterium]|nr:methylated-DNA--[protein]-cysteine S-methyltransferase [Xanthomonadaceae bacterium]
ALVVPCHRVIREDGSLGGWRWGLERKRVVLEAERATASAPPVARPPGPLSYATHPPRTSR